MMIRLAQIAILVLYLWLLVLIVAGCSEEVYRYPCMNPKNWEQAQCKRPECEILGECPDQLMKPELTKVKDER
jgi:hypothetical protein